MRIDRKFSEYKTEAVLFIKSIIEIDDCKYLFFEILGQNNCFTSKSSLVHIITINF